VELNHSVVPGGLFVSLTPGFARGYWGLTTIVVFVLSKDLNFLINQIVPNEIESHLLSGQRHLITALNLQNIPSQK
jgi:hypothetical protein